MPDIVIKRNRQGILHQIRNLADLLLIVNQGSGLYHRIVKRTVLTERFGILNQPIQSRGFRTTGKGVN